MKIRKQIFYFIFILQLLGKINSFITISLKNHRNKIENIRENIDKLSGLHANLLQKSTQNLNNIKGSQKNNIKKNLRNFPKLNFQSLIEKKLKKINPELLIKKIGNVSLVIKLKNIKNTQYIGKLGIGFKDEKFDMIFDTGKKN